METLFPHAATTLLLAGSIPDTAWLLERDHCLAPRLLRVL